MSPVPTAPPMSAAVLGGRLVLDDGVVDDGVLALEGERITYAGPAAGWAGPAPEPVGTIVPGYIDIHCHGGGGLSVTTGDPGDVVAVAAHHLQHGTTTMLASLVSAAPADITLGAVAIAEVAATGSSIVGSHLEGPFLDPGHKGAHDPAHLVLPDEALVRDWLAAGAVRMVTLAPELAGAGPVSRLLEEAGVVVGLGHTDADATTFAAALAELDRPLVTHLFNGMEPLHHRSPGPVAASLDSLGRGRAHVELIADGVHLADETVAMVFSVDPGRHVVLVSDAMAAAGMPDGDYELGPMRVRVVDGQARTTVDPPSLAGGTAHLADVVRSCVTAAGVDPVPAVAAATSTPAALLGLEDRGRLTAGLRADLLTLDDEWKVTRVMQGGAWVR